eukprot:gb/GECG01000924.1/.p1 GENE.gb/GECG01000924.1/~~gb/GECG01000924.1/.p1  ORF type:complete len:384 (+),score=34.51 gb/GECG01000924.1/:1-1152(+)
MAAGRRKPWAMIAPYMLLLSCILCAMARESSATPSDTEAGMPAVDIDSSKTSISGISAGGYAAVQVHVAYSSSFIGVGVIAGGPFYCAYDNEVTALTTCMQDGKNIDADVLAGITRNTALFGFADDPSNIQHDFIWVLSARNDTVVDRMVVQKLQEYYLNFIDNPHEQIRAVYDVDGEHSQLTNFYGNPCAKLGSPFINNCNYDAAGSILQHIYKGSLTKPDTHTFKGKIYEFNQAAFVDGTFWSLTFGLNPTGAVYVPPQCDGGQKKCILHVALHGCEMSLSQIQEKYVKYGGYNAWADANDIVILYPQAHSNPLNPKGCFDWWGYSGTAYASNIGTQTLTIKRMIEALQGQTLSKNNSASWPSDPLDKFMPNRTTMLRTSK